MTTQRRLKVTAGAVLVLGIGIFGAIHFQNKEMNESVTELSVRLNQLTAANETANAQKEESLSRSQELLSWDADQVGADEESPQAEEDELDPIVVPATVGELGTQISDFFHMAEEVRELSDAGEVGDFDSEMRERGLPLLSTVVAALGVHEKELATSEGAAGLLSDVLVKSLELGSAETDSIKVTVEEASAEAEERLL